MKKLIVLCLVSGIVCSTVFIVNAKNNEAENQLNLNNYVDSNNDGICDNKETNTNMSTGNNYVDSNNDDICDNKEINTNASKGNNYVDSNDDGVCDNIGNRYQYKHKNR